MHDSDLPRHVDEDPPQKKKDLEGKKGTSENGGTSTPTERDKWDYIEILARPISALLSAIAIVSVGFFGHWILDNRERQITTRNAVQQQYMLYTELLAQREESESALRKDMFKAILGEFFERPENGDIDISGRMLKLELLALNFSESLSLSPLFLEIDRKIDKNDVDNYRERLHSLARRVSSWQLSSLGMDGKWFTMNVPIEAVTENKEYLWPDDYIKATSGFKEKSDNFNMMKSDLQNIEFGGVTRVYSATFSKADLTSKTVNVDLLIKEIDEDGVTKRHISRGFKLSFFNFPMIDNTRLSEEQRFALVMAEFKKERGFIQIIGICFPGSHASQRDKPFLENIMSKLIAITQSEE